MDDFVTIKNLIAKNPGMSHREIGRLLHVSHNTVKAAISRETIPVYERQKKDNPALAPFADIIFEMANIKKFKGSRIFNELRSKGYAGGKTALYDYLRRIKLEIKSKDCTPYETAPAEQAQFDWSPYTVLIDKQVVPIIVYSYVNAFSRYQVLEVSLSQDQGAVFEALENSFCESGGVCQRLQTDNAKVFVTNASKNNFQWNQRYLNFMAHYGASPSRSLPGHPWSKGKVEKPFQYLEAHFVQGSEFEDFLDLQRRLKLFQKEVNERVHSVTKQAPAELMAKEKLSLIALPARRYVGIKEETRKVTADPFISYNGNRYSVPYMFAMKTVWIRISRGYYLQVYSQNNKLIAEHKLSLGKGQTVLKDEHFRGNTTEYYNFDRLSESFLKLFPGNELFLEKMKAQKRFNPRYHLARILTIAAMYKGEDVLEAISCCLRYNVFSSNFISGYLEKHHKHIFEVMQPIAQGEAARYSLTRENIIRDLREYGIHDQA